jgi:predicted ester cyclase
VSEADNIALYRRLIEDGVGVGNLDLLDELLDPDITLPTIEAFAAPTIEGLKSVNAAFRAGAPDLRATIDEIYATGDWVAARLTWTGTHTGELLGMPASGRRFSVTEFEIVRCRDGRIVDIREVVNMDELGSQLTN